MFREDRTTWKSNYFLKTIQLLNDYPKCFIVEVDNVSSKQMQQISMSLQGKDVMLMSKNTVMHKSIKGASGEQLSSGETAASHLGEPGLRVY